MLASACRRIAAGVEHGDDAADQPRVPSHATLVRAPPRNVADVRHRRIEREELRHIAEDLDLVAWYGCRSAGARRRGPSGGGGGGPDDVFGLEVVQQPLEVGESLGRRDVVMRAQQLDHRRNEFRRSISGQSVPATLLPV